MLPENLAEKILVGTQDCWLFLGATNSRGYGLTAIDGTGVHDLLTGQPTNCSSARYRMGESFTTPAV